MIPSPQEAYELLKQYNSDPFHLTHGRIVGEVLRWYAADMGYAEEVDLWQTVGTLHDLDFEMWPDEHCVREEQIMREAGIDAVTDGESPRVTGQLPPAGTTVQAGFCAMLYVTGETAPQAQDYARVPDVLGLDMRESAQALRLNGFEMNAQGDGLAARQSPIGGSYAPEGTQVLVTFEMP